MRTPGASGVYSASYSQTEVYYCKDRTNEGCMLMPPSLGSLRTLCCCHDVIYLLLAACLLALVPVFRRTVLSKWLEHPWL